MYQGKPDGSFVVAGSGTVPAGTFGNGSSGNFYLMNHASNGWGNVNVKVGQNKFWSGVALTQDQAKLVFEQTRSRYAYPFRRSLLPSLGITAYYDGTFSGSTAYDVVGGWGSKSIVGTMPASVRFQQNKSFAPSGSQCISLGTQNHYDANGWWYGQWISTTSSSQMRNEFNSSNGYFTMLRYNSAAGKAGVFYSDTVSDKSVNGIKTINDGRPHFCVAEFLPGSYARIWVDGVMEASVAVGAASWLGIQEGQYIFSGRQADSEFLSGKADFMYGKGTLNPAKVRALMYATYRF